MTGPLTGSLTPDEIECALGTLGELWGHYDPDRGLTEAQQQVAQKLADHPTTPRDRTPPMSTVDQPTTYTAAIGTAHNVVPGDFCDISVIENTIHGFRVDEDGNEIPDMTMGSTVVLDAVELPVRTDSDDTLVAAPLAADDVLSQHGWVRVGDWSIADTALYAPVERDENQ